MVIHKVVGDMPLEVFSGNLGGYSLIDKIRFFQIASASDRIPPETVRVDVHFLFDALQKRTSMQMSQIQQAICIPAFFKSRFKPIRFVELVNAVLPFRARDNRLCDLDVTTTWFSESIGGAFVVGMQLVGRCENCPRIESTA